MIFWRGGERFQNGVVERLQEAEMLDDCIKIVFLGHNREVAHRNLQWLCQYAPDLYKTKPEKTRIFTNILPLPLPPLSVCVYRWG